MVHLARVPNDSELKAPVVDGVDDVKLQSPLEDGPTISVYGSRFAAEELPTHEMPEREMPKEIAYRMIKDELSLDGNPMLNLASFVTTYMVSGGAPFFLHGTHQMTGRGSRETHGRSSTQKLYRL